MKATVLLKKDHAAVKELFKEFEKAGDRAYQKKQTLFEKIKQELELHAQVEEEIFYPAVKQARSEEAKELVQEAIEEHQVVKTLLAEISKMKPEQEQYDAKVTVLQENVEHHIKEEEGEMFPEARKQLSDERMEALGDEIEARKRTVKEKSRTRGAA